MWLFWIFSIVPISIGAYLWYKCREICWWEWLIGSASALAIAGFMQFISTIGQTRDVETVSGEIFKVSYHPEWVEEYLETHSESYACGTDSKGNTEYCTRTWTTIEHDTHPEHWVAHLTFGGWEETRELEQDTFEKIKNSFGNLVIDGGKQSTSHFGGSFDGGDNNIYDTPNSTKVIYPTTSKLHFENRVKAAPSLFSFSAIPTNISVYPYPQNEDWMNSERLVGTASVLIDPYKWDCMNSYLGPRKKVNVILVGFGNKPPEYGHYQEARWVGGKKNDLVITFGGGTRKQPPQWVYVFGWTEKEIVKENLQTILLTNKINDDIIPLITNEIVNNYTIKDWSKFDYISIEPPTWAYWVYFSLMIITQTVLYVIFHNNEIDKSYYGRWSRRGIYR